MRLTKWIVLPAACGLMVLTGAAVALADKSVELKGVHLCCGACVKGVTTALKGVEGVTPKCDREKSMVTLTSESDEALKKAVEALGAAGYFGETGKKGVEIKVSSAPKGKVKSLTLTGVHNCCGACCKAIKGAVKTVDGVKGDTAKPKGATFDVTGDFEAADVIKALNAAGFNATVK
jgi:copper chaperone CopZ